MQMMRAIKCDREREPVVCGVMSRNDAGDFLPYKRIHTFEPSCPAVTWRPRDGSALLAGVAIAVIFRCLMGACEHFGGKTMQTVEISIARDTCNNVEQGYLRRGPSYAHNYAEKT